MMSDAAVDQLAFGDCVSVTMPGTSEKLHGYIIGALLVRGVPSPDIVIVAGADEIGQCVSRRNCTRLGTSVKRAKAYRSRYIAARSKGHIE